MKFLFIVQGEGRGHLTQAITLESILRRSGHEVVEVWADLFFLSSFCPSYLYRASVFVST